MTTPIVTVVITCLNGKEWVDKCIPSLLESSLENFEVIFVDNGSIDGTAEYLLAHYVDPRIIIKRLEKNRGFTGGNNYGATFARANLLFFLSIDVMISKDTLATLVSAYQPTDGMIGPRVYTTNNDLSMQSYDRHSGGLIVDIFGYATKTPNANKLFYIEGCAFLIDRKKFINSGGFDDGLVTYTEDIDLSWRMWLYGYKNSINEETFVLHFGGSSSTHYSSKENAFTTYSRRFHTTKNMVRNALKSYQLHNVFFVVPVQCLLLTMEAGYYLIVQRNVKAFKNIMSALYWNVINIADTWKLRKKIQSARLHADCVIKKRMVCYPIVFEFFFRKGGPKYR